VRLAQGRDIAPALSEGIERISRHLSSAEVARSLVVHPGAVPSALVLLGANKQGTLPELQTYSIHGVLARLY
jgi:hypothetical protein